ncbi:MAG TPA: hypothetical protein HPP77_01600 [Candidatus Hydrogenedentes bacterium]|nr:hypothetical protein [Candidatus Hydrogenedentota bacterium]
MPRADVFNHVLVLDNARFLIQFRPVIHSCADPYRERLKKAAAAAVAVHLVALVVISWRVAAPSMGPGVLSRPIVLALQPPESQRERRLVESPVPTADSVEETALIAEHNSKAQDRADVLGTEPAPHFEKPAEFEQVAVPEAIPAQEPQPATPATAVSVQEHAIETPALAAQALMNDSATKPEQQPVEDQPLNLAKLDPPAAPETAPKPARGKLSGGVRKEGLAAFEAKQHELAPYLKRIQRTVEARWQASLRLQYRGTSPTKAVLDCAIKPDGTIDYVKVVEAGDSVIYASLCKEAIVQSGPFGPFPFKVPEVHRANALEIRWTFSFL